MAAGLPTLPRSYTSRVHEQLDYPQLSPQVFPQLLSLLQNGPVSIDIFLRFLNAIHAEVIYLTLLSSFFSKPAQLFIRARPESSQR